MKIPNLFGAIKFPENWNPFGFVQQQLQQIRQKTTEMHKRVATTPPATTTNSAATISTITGSAGNMPAASCTMPPAANLTAKITASNSGGSKSSSNPSTNTNISNNNNNNNNNNTKNLTGITGSSSGSSSGNNNRISGPAPPAPAPAPTVSPVKFSPDSVDLRLAPEGGSLRQRIYDCCAYVIFCATHRTIAVSVHSGTGAIWLPFTVLPSNRSWNEGALYGSFIVLSGGLSERFIALRESIPYQDAHLLEVARLQLPQSGEYVTRLVFLIRLDRASSSSSNNNNNNNSNNQFRCCQPNQSSTTRLCWLPLEQITSGLVEMAWGPELVQWCKWIAAPTPQRIRSISCADAISSSSSAGKIGLRNQLDSIAFDTMLRQANVTHRDIELAYSDFIDHCFPAHTMTLCSFRCFMSVRYDFEKDERRLRRLFKAFNFIGRNGYLSFRELLLGLAACEPSAAHVEPRIRFVFRYYDNRGKAVLFEDDFRRLMRDLCPADSDRALDQRISECAKLFRLQEIGSQFGITYDEFYRAVTVTGEGGFRGTSALCRAKRDIFSLISRTVANRQAKQSVSKKIRTKKSASSASSNNNNNNNNNDNIEESDETAAAAANIIGSIIGKKWHQGSCGRCKERDWSLFPAVLRQNSSGQISLFRRLQSSQTMCTSGENRNTTNNNNNNNININAKHQQKSRSPPSPPAPPAQVPLKSMIGIKKTIKTSSPTLANTSTNVLGTGESFLSPENVANRLLAAIRVFSRNKGTIEKPNGLMSGNANDTNRLMAMFGTIHDDMLRLHDNGYGKCVPISSPCFIIGDIHGNLEDLLTLEQTIWRTIPLAANLLFLGDYVDRGKWSVECALYVCALKSLYPHKVTLLRGNHEIRDIQRKYSFATECTAKYGKVVGERMWDMFNRIFDRLPIVSVIDDAIFAAHGGIPHDNAELAKQIARLPLDIVAPDRCDLVWEIVWSDPLQDALFLKVCDLLDVEPKAAGGFVRNTKRGAAWFFDSDGAKAFFAANRLTHIVRAHEVPPNGFWFHFGDKCVTVFSCSHYCGNQNECAVLFARQGAIRPIRIDTANNMPATDDH